MNYWKSELDKFILSWVSCKIMNYREILDNCFEKDQEAIKSGNKIKINEIFKENTIILKDLIEKLGIEILIEDKKYLNRAWLIAQHSDHDHNFQIQFLGMLLPMMRENKSMMEDCAFLIDRILVNKNAKQVFGTQFHGEIKIPETICDKELDILRQKVGLESMNDYIRRMKKYSI
jgi:hypothetical protein